MVTRRVTASVLSLVLLAACSGSSGGTESGGEAADATSATSAASSTPASDDHAPPAGLTALQLQAAGEAVEGFVDTDRPIDLTATFVGGATATVHVPPAAMEGGRVIRAIPVSDAHGDIGLVLEPAGAWLDAPITVAFSVVGVPLARFGRTDDEVIFGRAVVNDRDELVLARLRPIIIATAPDTVTAVGAPGERNPDVGDVMLGRDPDGVDPIDELAGEDELDEVDSPDGTTSQGATARAGAAAQLKNPRCTSYGDQKEMAELVELARKEPNVQVPECVEVIVRVSGLMDTVIQDFEISEYAIGERTVVATAAGATETIPLQGTENGWAALHSLSMSTWVNGSTKYAELQFGPMIPPGLSIPDPPPVAATYCQDVDLRDGSLSVTTKILDGNMLRVEVMPTAGVYPITCQAPFPSADTPSLIWDYLRLVLQLPETAPFVLESPVLAPVMRLVDSLQQLEEVSVRTNGDGTVTVSQDNMAVRLGLTMAVSFTPLDDEPKTLG